MDIDDGGPAFPASEWHYESQQYLVAGGMTLRDYFAAKAMQTYLTKSGTASPLSVAVVSYDMADAMLKARSQ